MRDIRTLSLGMLSVLTLAACQPADDTTVELDTDTTMLEESSSSSDGPYLDDENGDDSVELNINGESAAAGDVRTIQVAVSDWAFEPSMIAVQKGERVQLELTGGSGIHSFAIPELGMNIRVEPGETVVVDLPTDAAGTYEVLCRIPCGAGHRDMKATVVIS